MHAEVFELTSKASIKALTTNEAGLVINHFEDKLDALGQPNIPQTRVNGRMRGKILKYKHLLKWHDVHFWNFVKKMIGMMCLWQPAVTLVLTGSQTMKDTKF